MHVVTLIAPRGGLEIAAVDALRSAWGGLETVWLSPGEAAEFRVRTIPDNRWSVWEDMQRMSVDLVIQPAGSRRREMLLADMDSTMIQQECIDELAEVAGVGDRVRSVTARAMNGELDFDAALRERVALLRGLPAKIIDDVLNTRISLTAGGATLLATMRAHGAYCALVSGGFTAFSSVVAARLGFDTHRANSLLVRDGLLTGEVARPILGPQAKLQALHELTAMRGLSLGNVLAVGDGANDLAMLQAAGAGVALHAKPAVAAECDIRINNGDLTALLFLQGYRRDEFVALDQA